MTTEEVDIQNKLRELFKRGIKDLGKWGAFSKKFNNNDNFVNLTYDNLENHRTEEPFLNSYYWLADYGLATKRFEQGFIGLSVLTRLNEMEIREKYNDRIKQFSAAVYDSILSDIKSVTITSPLNTYDYIRGAAADTAISKEKMCILREMILKCLNTTGFKKVPSCEFLTFFNIKDFSKK